MAHQNFNHLIDANGRLKAAGLVGSTADGSDIVDLGPGFAAFDVVIAWTACEVATGDERYDIIVQGSNSSSFGSGVYELVKTSFGDSTVNGDATDTPPSGLLVLSGSNVAITSATDGNTVGPLRYARIRTVVAGTVASGMNYEAWLTKPQK